MEKDKLNVVIRRVSSADLDQVREIFGWYTLNSAATFEVTPRTAAEWSQLHEELAGLGLPFLVAEADGRIVGYAYAGPWRRKPAYKFTVEDSVYVLPGETGRGIGRRLLSDLLSACADVGIRQVIAVIADSDAQASVRLHESSGFTHAGRLADVGYKHGNWIGTLLMQCALG